jgi:serine/threonine-protein kinase SRPK3
MTHELTIEKADDINNLPILYDVFEVQGPRGSHLCFLNNLLGSDVAWFRRSAPNKELKPYIVKNIIGQVWEALVQLHSFDIIHAGVIASGTLNCKLYLLYLFHDF